MAMLGVEAAETEDAVAVALASSGTCTNSSTVSAESCESCTIADVSLCMRADMEVASSSCIYGGGASNEMLPTITLAVVMAEERASKLVTAVGDCLASWSTGSVSNSPPLAPHSFISMSCEEFCCCCCWTESSSVRHGRRLFYKANISLIRFVDIN